MHFIIPIVYIFSSLFYGINMVHTWECSMHMWKNIHSGIIGKRLTGCYSGWVICTALWFMYLTSVLVSYLLSLKLSQFYLHLFQSAFWRCLHISTQELLCIFGESTLYHCIYPSLSLTIFLILKFTFWISFDEYLHDIFISLPHF